MVRNQHRLLLLLKVKCSMALNDNKGAIGVFDSGYGGLTILSQFAKLLPEYDYIYLGDNARAPYGNRSFDVVYEFTLQAVRRLFEMGCPLVILGCNTASAKALRTIQQCDLPKLDASRRVLGIIRPTVEVLGDITRNGHVGIFATEGTVQSQSYSIELKRMYPGMKVTAETCSMWVPLIENREYESEGADYFVRKNIEHILSKDPQIDTFVLGCTHYPLLLEKIKKYTPQGITIVSQGEIVANSLRTYLLRHPDMENRCIKNGSRIFYTTESAEKFSDSAKIFLKDEVEAHRLMLS